MTVSYTTSPLPLGTHIVYAIFAGNQNSQTSISYPVLQAVGAAPAITSAGSGSFTIGSPGSFTVTGSPTPGISKSGALPAGVSFTPNGDGTATIAGTPGPGTSRSLPARPPRSPRPPRETPRPAFSGSPRQGVRRTPTSQGPPRPR